MILKIKYLDSFYYRSYSLKGLYEQLRITRFLLSYYMNNFIKLNSPLFDHPDHFEFVKISGLPDSSDTSEFSARL